MKFFLLIVVMLAGMGFILYNNDSILVGKENPPKDNVVRESLTEAPTQPEGWGLFQDVKMEVSFSIPPDYEIEKNGEYSVLAKPPKNEKFPAGEARFFYVSTVPSNLKNDQTATVYNYSPAFHQKLLTIKVGEMKNLSDNPGQKEWYDYERLSDEVFNGNAAKVYVNRKPWEFPAGTWEYRYIFEFAEKTVIAGGYIVGGPSDASLNLPVLNQIMMTLMIK